MFKEMTVYSINMAVNKRNMTIEELEEYNRQYIRKTSRYPDYRDRQKEKEYRQENRDRINAEARERYHANIEAIHKKKKEKPPVIVVLK